MTRSVQDRLVEAQLLRANLEEAARRRPPRHSPAPAHLHRNLSLCVSARRSLSSQDMAMRVSGSR